MTQAGGKAVVRRLPEIPLELEVKLRQERRKLVRALVRDGVCLTQGNLAQLLGIPKIKFKEYVYGRVYGLERDALESLRGLCDSAPSKPDWRVFADPRYTPAVDAWLRMTGVFDFEHPTQLLLEVAGVQFITVRGASALILLNGDEAIVVPYPFQVKRDDVSRCLMGANREALFRPLGKQTLQVILLTNRREQLNAIFFFPQKKRDVPGKLALACAERV